MARVVLSPFERARQILEEIDTYEKKKRQPAETVRIPPKEAKLDNDIPTEEGQSMESPLVQEETSSIYTEEIGTESKLLKFDSQSILQGVIFSEILGRPRSMKRR